MMKKVLFFIFLVVAMLTAVSASIDINEIEINPAGSNTNTQWIEIYNDGDPENLTGWYIKDKDGNDYAFPGIIITDFYVLDNLDGIDTSDQNLTLFEVLTVRDKVNDITDSFDDDNTASRLPDGSGDFVFQSSTKGFPNVPNVIENKTYSPSCVIKSRNLTLSAQVSGFCVSEVIFGVLINGNEVNFTGQNQGGDHYSATLTSQDLEEGTINWTVYMKDCFNRTMQDGTEEVYVNANTELSINPPTPDGNDGWYVSEPEFTLENNDAFDIFYQWDSDATLNYNSPFGLEDTPNQANITGGILELNYWGDVCEEETQTKILKVDLKDPGIIDLNPENNSVITHTLKPTIQAYLEEFYGFNSGIKHSSVMVSIDGLSVPINVSSADSIDAIVTHTPTSDLNMGGHNVTIYVEDNAGRNSELTWFFEINFIENSDFNMSVYSPENKTYNTKIIPINVSLTDFVRLEYISYQGNKTRKNLLCSNCEEYGFERKRTKTMIEGENRGTIRATNKFGIVKEENVTFFIDSKKPSISRIEPRNNKVTNGSDFSIKFTEENLKEIKLFWNPNLSLSCNPGVNTECHISTDLSLFNNQTIEFYFEVSDSVNTVKSKVNKVKVDTSPPILTINSPVNTTYNKNVPFNITVSEEVLLEYYDSSASNARWKTLCNNCDDFGTARLKVVRFSVGNHDILIRATDDAGNSDVKAVSFNSI